MSQDKITQLRNVVAQVAKIDDPDSIGVDNDIYVDLGVQSTAALDLLLSLEDEFDVQIPDEEFGEARTVGGLLALIVKLS